MKKNQHLVAALILFIVCVGGFYVFQNKALVQETLLDFQAQEKNNTNKPNKSVLKTSALRRVKSQLVVKEQNKSNKINKLLDVPSTTQYNHSIENNPKLELVGDEDIPVIPLEEQVAVPDYVKEQYKKRADKMESQGYVEADDFSMLQLSGEAITLQQLGSESLDNIYDSLVFEPALVEGTLFDEGEYLGHKASSGLIEEEDFHGNREFSDVEYQKKESERKRGEFSRYYHFSDLGTVKLTERFLPQSSQAHVTPELMNEDVNGNYAYYLVQKGASGQSLSMLTWPVGNRQFILEVAHNGDHEGETVKRNLFDLAKSIP